MDGHGTLFIVVQLDVEFLCFCYDLFLLIDLLPCFYRSVISLYWPSFCVLLTFLRFSDAMTVSRMLSLLLFLMSYLTFVLVVLHISVYSIRCLSSPFSTNSLGFVIMASISDDILEFSSLLIALAIHARFVGSCMWCFRSWCRCYLVLVVSRIGFSVRLGIRSSVVLFVWYVFLVASGSLLFHFHLYVQFNVARNHSVATSNVNLVDDCYNCNDVCPVC